MHSLCAGALTHNYILPMGHLQPGRVHLVQVENVNGLELGWVAAGPLDLGAAAGALLLPLGLQVE